VREPGNAIVAEAGIAHAVFDEAGDTGTGERASRFLVVAGIACRDLQPLRRAVLRARKSLRKPLRSLPELKASHTPPGVTAKLLARLAALDICIHAAVVDKHLMPRPQDPEDWYRESCAQVIAQALTQRRRLIVTLDRRYTGSTLADRLVDFIVARTAGPGTTLSFMHADSHQEKALQAADAVAWSLFRKYERGDDRFYQLIADRVGEEAPP
jgi:hypothetical protein